MMDLAAGSYFCYLDRHDLRFHCHCLFHDLSLCLARDLKFRIVDFECPVSRRPWEEVAAAEESGSRSS